MIKLTLIFAGILAGLLIFQKPIDYVFYRLEVALHDFRWGVIEKSRIDFRQKIGKAGEKLYNLGEKMIESSGEEVPEELKSSNPQPSFVAVQSKRSVKRSRTNKRTSRQNRRNKE